MFRGRTGAAAALIIIISAAPACRKPAQTEAKSAEKAAAPASTSAAPNASAATPAEKPPEPAKPVPETIPPVVARVNGQDVPKSDFDRLLKQMEMQAGQPVPQGRRDEVFRAVLDQLLTYTALVHEAKSRKVEVTPAEAKQVSDAKIAELRKQIPDPKAFNKALAERNMTLDRLRADIRNDIAINKLIQAEVASTPAVTDTEVREFYDKNPNEFTGLRASHILIRPAGFDEDSKKKARAQAEDLMKQARAGADFADLARKHSADGSAQQGGDLGFFTKGSMVPAFSDAAFALKPGEVSDVVETQFGFHVIMSVERKDVPFDDASTKIREFLTAKHRDERQKAFVADVKSRSKIEVLF
ncbi:MAG TPA: peptidylprolyl isomerase [Vicinamibacterales bacterium]|jgi:peptidyl-prolyl cis-trans isomerase C|nr:peptidylprolyl isomerase [Vicinamibacterales bacterium]